MSVEQPSLVFCLLLSFGSLLADLCRAHVSAEMDETCVTVQWGQRTIKRLTATQKSAECSTTRTYLSIYLSNEASGSASPAAGRRVPPPTCCIRHQMASLLVAAEEMASLPRVAAHKRTQATTNEHHVVRERPFKKPPRRVFTSVGNNSQLIKTFLNGNE